MRSFILLSFTGLALAGCVTESTYVGSDRPVVEKKINNVEAARTRISLALNYLAAGDSSQAKFNLEKAAKFAPDLPEVHYSAAYYYQQVGEPARARESYNKALALAPNDPNTLNNYGVFLCDIGDYQGATEQLLKAIAIPSYIRVAESYENLALCALEFDKFEDAENYLNSAVQHNTQRASSLINLAALHYAKSDFHRAERVLKRYLDSGRISSRSLLLNYLIQERMGHIQDAENIAKTIEQTYPTSIEARIVREQAFTRSEFEHLRTQYRNVQLRSLQSEMDGGRIVAKPKIKVLKKKAPPRKTSDETLVAAKPVSSDVSVSTVQPNAVTLSAQFPAAEKAPEPVIEKPVVTEPQVTESEVIHSQADKIQAMNAVKDEAEDVVSASQSEAEKSLNTATEELAMVVTEDAESPAAAADTQSDAVQPSSQTDAQNPEPVTEADSTPPQDTAETALVATTQPVIDGENQNDTDAIPQNGADEGVSVENTEPELSVESGNPVEPELKEPKQTPVGEQMSNEAEVVPAAEEETVQEQMIEVQPELIEQAENIGPVEPEVDTQAPVPQENASPATEVAVNELVDESHAPESEAAPQPSEVEAEQATEQNASTEQQENDEQGSVTSEPAEAIHPLTPPYHVVKSGETLYMISRKYNIRMDRLREWNKIRSVDKVRSGSKIYLNTPKVYHKVVEGDTLFSISTRYNIRMDKLKQWNHLDDAATLRPGFRLLLVDPENYDL